MRRCLRQVTAQSPALQFGVLRMPRLGEKFGGLNFQWILDVAALDLHLL